MKQIKFSFNWNNKLNCKAFSTIRPYSEGKYIITELYEILLKEHVVAKAKIVNTFKFDINQMTNNMAFLDTGYDANETRKIIQTMYKLKDGQAFNLSYVLFLKIDEPII